MNTTYHKPVLVNEVLEYLNLQPNSVYLDATFGGGGHTRAILEAEPSCKVIALDWDTRALEMNGEPLQQEFPGRLTLAWGNFTNAKKLLADNGIQKVDGILADFGTSQHQIFERAGFSFNRETPLDMRMSPSHQKMTAAELINKATAEKLSDIFFELGEERYARRIASEIVEARKKGYIKTTTQLAEIIRHAVPLAYAKGRIHPATRTFQALRIYINHELDNIKMFMPTACALIKPKGRLVLISFHSLEDRMVKHFFKQKEIDGIGIVATKNAVSATEEEIHDNPSSRSAKLRAFEIL